MIDKELRIRLLLGAQMALLGNISPNIRCVSLGISDDEIIMKAVFDGEISEADSESMDEVASQRISYFETEKITTYCIRIDYPDSFKGELLDFLVFQRKEI